MGYDIFIYTANDQGEIGRCVDSSLGMSYNWSDLKKVNFAGSKVKWGKNEETMIGGTNLDLWSFSEDGHRRSGRSIEKSTRRALDQLKSVGIFPGTPDPTNSNWWWGTQRHDPKAVNPYACKQLSQRERLEVFAFHLRTFNLAGKKYPDCYFFGDHDKSKTVICDE